MGAMLSSQQVLIVVLLFLVRRKQLITLGQVPHVLFIC